MSTDKKHNINGKLTTENIRGFFHMQEYSFLLIPVYNLLHFMIIWISVCSKIRYVLIKVHALALDTYTAVSILHTKYTADYWSRFPNYIATERYRDNVAISFYSLITIVHTTRLSQDTTCIIH